MFERFSDGARQAVVHAQESARELRHDYVGTEHLLLGLLWDSEEVAHRALSSFGVTRETVSEKLLAVVGRGERSQPGQIPFTPGAKKSLELALREALSLDHNEIGTGHVLLGLIHEDGGMGTRLLESLSVPVADLRTRVIQRLGEPAPRGIGRPSVRIEQVTEARFSAQPDPELRLVLMKAAGRALTETRESFGITDVLAVLPESRRPPEEAGGDGPPEAGGSPG